MGLCRALTAFFICPAAAIGTVVVSENVFQQRLCALYGSVGLNGHVGCSIRPVYFRFRCAASRISLDILDVGYSMAALVNLCL